MINLKGKYCFDSKQKIYKFVNIREVIVVPNVFIKKYYYLRKQNIKHGEIIDTDYYIELPAEEVSYFSKKDECLEMYYKMKDLHKELNIS